MSLQQRLTALAQAVGGDVKSLVAAQGSLQALTTSAKSNLVAAVNELKSAVDAAGGGASDELLHGPAIVSQKLLEGPVAFNNWIAVSGNLVIFRQLLDSLAGLTYLVNNSVAMQSLAGNATAMGEVAASASAMGAMAASQTSMNALVADATARTAVASSAVAVAALAASPVAMHTLVNNQPMLSALVSSAHWGLFKASTVLPVFGGSLAMVADAAPGFATTSASSVNAAGFEAFRAFDGVAASRWASAAAAASGAWLRVSFVQPRFVHTLRVVPNANGVYTAWRLDYSDDAANWSPAYSAASYTAQAGVATTHPVAVAGRHRHWRFFVVTSSTGFAATRELELDGWL